MRTRPTTNGAPSRAAKTMKIHTPDLLLASSLNPAPYNPRKFKPAQLAAMKASIRVNGFLENLVVQRRSPKYGPQVIIGGHMRLRALTEICVEDAQQLPTIPCVVLDVDDRKAKQLNIALNRLGGEFDNKLLADVLTELDRDSRLTPVEVELMGFTGEDEVARYLRLNDPPTIDPADDLEPFARSVTLSLAFTDTKRRDSVRRILDKRAKAADKPSGEVIFELLTDEATRVRAG